ncbi:MAG: ABC transporter ATP-binding protein [Myxococcales bacterium]|nr:ABC transporter ATP-binding protein [Myxococcales bacterium]
MKPMQVELSQVDKRFGKVHALRSLDLVLPPGAKVALIGPNGSGKTTLIRVLLGLVQHRGQVRIDGAAVRREALAPRVAYVPQIAPQLAASCRELVRTVATLRGLTEARVAELAARLALELPEIADRPFRSLSGGSKQKLLIALALAARPDLLILDEPTASLDAEARGRFFTLSRELAGEATLILCSHRLEEIRSLVDHVVALADGRVSYQGDAAHYLAQRVGSVLELKVEGDEPWLSEHGFAQGASGWWSRSVDRQTKLALVPAAGSALGTRLLDLVVRDIDLVELRGEGRRA